jgi:hypothetical protein
MKKLVMFGVKGVAIVGLLASSLAFTVGARQEYLGECFFDEMYQDWACGVGCPTECNCNWNRDCPEG